MLDCIVPLGRGIRKGFQNVAAHAYIMYSNSSSLSFYPSASPDRHR
jgi:hypothetical protein